MFTSACRTRSRACDNPGEFVPEHCFITDYDRANEAIIITAECPEVPEGGPTWSHSKLEMRVEQCDREPLIVGRLPLRLRGRHLA